MVRRANELRRGRRRGGAASRSPSFQTRLQRLKTHADAVQLIDQTTDAQTDEKVQAFARLAAVHGGTYMLNRDLEGTPVFGE